MTVARGATAAFLPPAAYPRVTSCSRPVPLLIRLPGTGLLGDGRCVLGHRPCCVWSRPTGILSATGGAAASRIISVLKFHVSLASL